MRDIVHWIARTSIQKASKGLAVQSRRANLFRWILLLLLPLVRQHLSQQGQVRAYGLVHEEIFAGAFSQKITGIWRQAGQGVVAELLRHEKENPVGTAPERGKLLIVQKCGRHVGIV